MNPNWIKKYHKIVDNKVCCIGHLCEWHYATVKEFEHFSDSEREGDKQ